MEFLTIDSKTLENEGQILKPPFKYQNESKPLPILLNGLVYKPFSKKDSEKAWQIELITKLEKLAIKQLAHIKGLYNNNFGYVYYFNSDPVLYNALNCYIALEKRLRWIHDLIEVYIKLNEHGLKYFDYHSSNILVGDSITLLDIDGIKRKFNARELAEYLLELLVSILINFDLTSNYSNFKLYELFSKFFNEPKILSEENLDFMKLFDCIVSKNTGEVTEFREDVLAKI